MKTLGPDCFVVIRKKFKIKQNKGTIKDKPRSHRSIKISTCMVNLLPNNVTAVENA